MSFNQWLTENSNFVTFVNISLTILLTALNVWFARNSQRHSRDSLKQNEKIRIENNTPNIIAYFHTEDLDTIYFKLSNIGTNAAKNITLNLTPKNRSHIPEYLKDAYMLKESVAFLAPGQTLSALAGNFMEQMDSDKTFSNYDLHIKYEDIDDNSYEREYVLDLNMYNGYYGIRRKDLHDLNKEMQKIEKHFRKTVGILKSQEKHLKESTIVKNSRRIRKNL